MNETANFEKQFWGTCTNTWGEEIKQFLYASRMQLRFNFAGVNGGPPFLDMGGARVLDIGGGPVSLLLKCVNVRGVVVDPLDYPTWVYERYIAAGITHWVKRGEDIGRGFKFDECWLYNVLQHVDSPEVIIANARCVSKLVRLFEWIDVQPHEGHPQLLTKERLESALGGAGITERINESRCVGRAFYGVWQQ